MPTNRKTLALYVVLGLGGLLASIQVSGCSVFGAIVGSGIDAANRRPTQLFPTGELTRFHSGDSLVLHLKDTTRVTGQYVGPTRFSLQDYRARYETCRMSNSAIADLPPLGETVQIRVGNQVPSHGEGILVAFTHDGVEIGRGLHHWRYSQISELAVVGGHEIAGERLLDLRLAGALPVITGLLMTTADGERNVPLDDVEWLSGPKRTNMKTVFFVVGLAVDVIVVAALVSYKPEPKPEPQPSCDYNGTGWAVRLERARMRALGEVYREVERRSEDESLADESPAGPGSHSEELAVPDEGAREAGAAAP